MIKTLLIINKYGGNISFESFLDEINDVSCLNDLSVLVNLGVAIKTDIEDKIYYFCKENEFCELLNKFTTRIEIKSYENGTIESLRVPNVEIEFIKQCSLKSYVEDNIYRFLVIDKTYKLLTESYRC